MRLTSAQDRQNVLLLLGCSLPYMCFILLPVNKPLDFIPAVLVSYVHLSLSREVRACLSKFLQTFTPAFLRASIKQLISQAETKPLSLQLVFTAIFFKHSTLNRTTFTGLQCCYFLTTWQHRASMQKVS